MYPVFRSLANEVLLLPSGRGVAFGLEVSINSAKAAVGKQLVDSFKQRVVAACGRARVYTDADKLAEARRRRIKADQTAT